MLVRKKPISWKAFGLHRLQNNGENSGVFFRSFEATYAKGHEISLPTFRSEQGAVDVVDTLFLVGLSRTEKLHSILPTSPSWISSTSSFSGSPRYASSASGETNSTPTISSSGSAERESHPQTPPHNRQGKLWEKLVHRQDIRILVRRLRKNRA